MHNNYCKCGLNLYYTIIITVLPAAGSCVISFVGLFYPFSTLHVGVVSFQNSLGSGQYSGM